MEEFLDLLKNKASFLLHNKKNLISFLVLVILILGLFVGINLIRQQQIIKSRAGGDPIVFVESSDVFQKEGRWFTKTNKVSLQITSPLGPPASANSLVPGGTAVPSPVINTSQHVYILEVDDTVDTPDGIEWDKTAQLFYQKYPDKYDFLAIFPTFKPKQEIPASGLHSSVQNEVRGICIGITKPNRELWESDKLKGIEIYPYSDSNYQAFLDYPDTSGRLLLQETSHQWLTSIGRISRTFPPGFPPPDGINASCLNSTTPLLLDDDFGHWSKGLQMPGNYFGAMREARPWIDNNDGTYSHDPKLYDKPRKFHPFDLYLMGFADRSEIKGEYLLLSDMDNPDTLEPSQPDETGIKPGPRAGLVTTHAKAQKVTIDDIIRIAGEERNPGVKDSQKDFTIAFVILKKPGQEISDTMIKAINKAANVFPNQWAYATDNKSTMNEKF